MVFGIGCGHALTAPNIAVPIGRKIGAWGLREAVGMSEETDAVVVVVSEETGQVLSGESGNCR